MNEGGWFWQRYTQRPVSGETGLFGRDGTKLWSANLGGTCHAPPVTADGMLLVGCDDGKLYAFRGRR